jgi:hypothetical protein
MKKFIIILISLIFIILILYGAKELYDYYINNKLISNPIFSEIGEYILVNKIEDTQNDSFIQEKLSTIKYFKPKSVYFNSINFDAVEFEIYGFNGMSDGYSYVLLYNEDSDEFIKKYGTNFTAGQQNIHLKKLNENWIRIIRYWE